MGVILNTPTEEWTKNQVPLGNLGSDRYSMMFAL